MTKVKKVKNPIVGDGTTMYYPEDSTYSYGNWFPTREQQDYINNRGKRLKNIEVSKNKNYTGKITEPFIQNGDTIMWDLMPNNYKSLFISTPEGRMELYMPKRDKNGNTTFQGWDTPETKKYNRAFDAVMSTWFPNLYQNNVKGLESTRLDNSIYKEKYGGSTQFKCGGMKRVPRKKAFWGALIGAALSAIGGIGSSIINSTKQEQIAMQNYKQQKELMDKLDAQSKQTAENEYYNQLNANSGIYNSIRKSLFSAKMGGKFKKCRKKAEWGTDDTGSLISSIFGIGSNIATTAIDANTQLKTNELALAAAGRIGKQYNYVTPNFNSIRETINERNSDINEIQKRRRGQLNSLYLS